MIKSDTFLLEKIAREKLGMIKPGDTVIIFEDK
jgi:cell division protein FtsB